MKKLLAAILVATMLFALVGCGGDSSEPISLVEVMTEEGISMLLPSDLALDPAQEMTAYINAKTGESAVFTMTETGGVPISAWTEEDILAMYQSRSEDAVVESFDNQSQINGKDALVTSVSYTTPKGNPIIVTLVIITDGVYDYIINFTNGADPSVGSLSSNMQECINSIMIAE